jgi:dolichol-phosphate mannosyltransferase
MSPSSSPLFGRILDRLHTPLLQFCLVGLTGAFVDLSAYRFLLHFQTPIPLARGLAIWVAMTWNFFLNRNWTFRRSRDCGPWTQYLKYVSSSALGAVISWSTSMALTQLVSFFHAHLMPAAVLGIGAGTLTNFLLSSRWVFARRKR